MRELFRFMAYARGFATVLVLSVPTACGGSPEPSSDAGVRSCEDSEDCDDGVFCNGVERCVEAVCVATPGCRESQECDEAAERCVTRCDRTEDADGDGARAVECGGNDCDDSNPDRQPGTLEICDVDQVDEDCDPSTFGFRDLDGDGVGDSACCNARPDGTSICGLDCDDASSSVSPRAPEVCNGFDDDCDGSVDEGVATEFYEDADGDGFGGTEGATRTECRQPPGFAPSRTDCDDGDPSINPGAVEVCEGSTDEDCSGAVDDVEGGCDCTAGESRECGLSGRCAGATQSCDDGRFGPCSIQPIAEACNTVDDDCDGSVDEGQTVRCFVDADNDGVPTFGAPPVDRCPDEARAAAPFLRCPLFHTATAPTSVTESDCDDSRARETFPDSCHSDSDGDGFGRGAPTYKCPSDPCPGGLVPNNSDCCPDDSRGFPGSTAYLASHRCPSSDTNCDGRLERQYGFFSCTRILGTCTGGTSGNSPYLRQDVGCGTISTQVDRCTEVGGVCQVSWSGYSGSGSDIRVQVCR